MPQKVNFPIVLPYNKTKQIGINPERTTNMYAVNIGDENSTPALINTWGLTQAFTLSAGKGVRNLFYFNNNLYVVCGRYVYIVDKLLTPIQIGQIGTTTGDVGISANNAHQVIFVDGTGGWIYNDSTNTFEMITSSDFPSPAPTSVVFFNGFFIVNSVGTNLWAVSNLNDGLNWDATQTQTFQSAADTIVAVNVLKTSIFIFGKQNTELWLSQPQANFPFSRDSTMRFQFGTPALGSVVQSEDMLFWLAQTADGRSSIKMTNGGWPESVSTTDIDQEINSYSTVADAEAYMFRTNGHLFYSISFPTADVTWLYDVTNNFWVNQEMQDGSLYIISDAQAFQSNIYGGDRDNPIVYLFDINNLTNNGQPMNRQRITNPFVSPDLRAIRLNSLEVDVVQGQGSLNPPGDAPWIELQVSYDRGITWEKQRIAYISKMGLTVGYRCVFRNLGINKDFCFKLTVYAAINLTIRAAAINYDLVGN